MPSDLLNRWYKWVPSQGRNSYQMLLALWEIFGSMCHSMHCSLSSKFFEWMAATLRIILVISKNNVPWIRTNIPCTTVQLLEHDLITCGWRGIKGILVKTTLEQPGLWLKRPIMWDTCPSLMCSISSAWTKQPMKLCGFCWVPDSWDEHGGLLHWSVVHHASE